MFSVYDLAFAYLQKFYRTEPDNMVKTRVIIEMKKSLYRGWTTEEISTSLKQANPNDGPPDLDFMFGEFKEGNLLLSEKMYYHNLLRCCPPPPTVNWDINTGEITPVDEQEYFLEMRASITLDQITDYYISQMEIKPDEVNLNRYKGSFKCLIDKYGLDLTLFMIDASKNLIFSEHLNKPVTPMAIAENITQAQELYNQKRNEIIAAGDDKIVYKNRKLKYN